MRAALHALTVRGRSFLAGGVTAAACGLLLGERAFLRLGVLTLLIPVVSVAWVALHRRRLHVERHAADGQVEIGQAVDVGLELRAVGRGTPELLVEEQLPYVLGSRPRFVVDPLGPGEAARLRYTVRSEVRGSHRLGPLRVQVGDPFGMLALTQTFHGTDALVVTPRVEPLPALSLGGARAGSGDDRPRSFAGGNAADVTVREYRRGDDLRRVHWRASAHHGELLVRREEQPWQARCTLLVDNRARAHRGRGAASSLESAVSAAASIACHLADRGYDVRLVSAGGEELGRGAHAAGSGRALLRALAVLPAAELPLLDPRWIDETVADGPFVAVVGAVEENDRPFFARLGRLGGSSRAVALDVAGWDPSYGTAGTLSDGAATIPAATAWLSSIGWRAATWRRGEPLANAWQELRR
ncbi:MAG: DUF58 domain-containing protein [Marmoricola sp.]